MPFRDDFVWGATSTAYQLEGAAKLGGRGVSVWDEFCRKGGTIHNNENGDISCDHYGHYNEDIALFKQIGLRALRFSISWPRVLPMGTGQPNHEGLAFYDRYVDTLLESGIDPYVTLFHWDYPAELYYRGGWLNPDSPKWFADYTSLIVDRLSDRVTNWITLNEPVGFVECGHYHGVHAPGDKLSWAHILRIGHNALLAHGLSVQAIRAASKRDCKVGMALCGTNAIPATESAEDIEAARSAMFCINGKSLMPYSWWADPVFLGQYPEDGLKLFGDDMPTISDTDMRTISQKLDFFGFNLYYGNIYKAGTSGNPEPVAYPQGIGLSSVDWPVTPQAMRWAPRFLFERYRIPVMVVENGFSNLDWIALDGGVHDPQRIDYCMRYLAGLKEAVEDGVDVLGYLHWAIMDSFEWSLGYKVRFGMIYVDYASQNRILKDSAHWYRKVIASNGNLLSPA